jgi:acyl-CoA synthetase (AMP-forming)/AMP-acid ligase II
MSVVEAVRAHAARAPDTEAFIFLERGEREADRMTFGRLDLRARAVAARLQSLGCRGERVLVALPTGPRFIEALFGCLYAGAIAVPAPEPVGRHARERVSAIRADCDPRLELAEPAAVPDIADEEALAWQALTIAGEDLAFLQYTSGSISAPKGVMVTHAALLANLRMLVAAFRGERPGRMVSWLPVHHDMGLLGGVLAPAYRGACSVLLPPLSFLQDPLRWPRAVARYGGAMSGGPSFAFAMCADALARRELGEADLSCWEVAFCGAEPVRAESLERFAAALAPNGFRRSAFLPCYGLAEATLLASAGVPDEGIVKAGEAVTCGKPPEGQRIAIADPDTLEPVEAGRTGEILLCGPNVAAGYWNRRAESDSVFRARLKGDSQRTWLRTGDLGFISEGRLAVTGRLKDLVIIRGENHHAEDLERTATESHSALAGGGGAAFSMELDGAERLVIVFEAPQADAPAIGPAVMAAVAERHGVVPHELVLIRLASLPRTANGKVRRARCRELYLAGELRSHARFPGAVRKS